MIQWCVNIGDWHCVNTLYTFNPMNGSNHSDDIDWYFDTGLLSCCALSSQLLTQWIFCQYYLDIFPFELIGLHETAIYFVHRFTLNWILWRNNTQTDDGYLSHTMFWLVLIIQYILLEEQLMAWLQKWTRRINIGGLWRWIYDARYLMRILL